MQVLNCVKEICFLPDIRGSRLACCPSCLHDHSTQLPDAYLFGCARYPSQRASDDRMKRTSFLFGSFLQSVICQVDRLFSSQVAGRFLEVESVNFFCRDPFQLLGGWRCRLGSQEYDIHEVNVEPRNIKRGQPS